MDDKHVDICALAFKATRKEHEVRLDPHSVYAGRGPFNATDRKRLETGEQTKQDPKRAQDKPTQK